MKAGEFLGEPDTCPEELETYMHMETSPGLPAEKSRGAAQDGQARVTPWPLEDTHWAV